MNTLWTRRIGAAMGAVYVVIGLLRGEGEPSPGFHASRGAIVNWMHTSGGITSSKYATAFLELLALLCLLVFFAYLSDILRQTEGASGYLPATVLGAGTLAVALKIASFPAYVVAHVWAKDGVDPRVIGMLLDMGDVAMALTLAAMGLALAAVAVATIPTVALPRWLGWGAAITSVALFVNVAIAYRTPDMAPAVFLFLLWTLVTSIVLVRRAGQVPVSESTATTRDAVLAG